MPYNTLQNYTSEEIVRRAVIQRMRRDGWKVRFVRHNDVVIGFRANYKHVNLRGKYSLNSQWLGAPHQSDSVVGWAFWIYIRNANGGYIRAKGHADLDAAIEKAKEIAGQEEPEIPTWKRSDLPEPFKFNPSTEAHYSLSRNRRRGTPGIESDLIVALSFEALVYRIRGIGLVAIDSSCRVNVDATLTPGNKAWVLLECSGNRGNFLIVTDGDCFYPVRRMPGNKLKISMDLRLRTVDLSRLDANDVLYIETAVREYIKWYTSDNK